MPGFFWPCSHRHQSKKGRDGCGQKILTIGLRSSGVVSFKSMEQCWKSNWNNWLLHSLNKRQTVTKLWILTRLRTMILFLCQPGGGGMVVAHVTRHLATGLGDPVFFLFLLRVPWHRAFRTAGSQREIVFYFYFLPAVRCGNQIWVC